VPSFDANAGIRERASQGRFDVCGEVGTHSVFVYAVRTGGAVASGKCGFERHREITGRSRAERSLTGSRGSFIHRNGG
jgi:hypothetical protein